MEIGDSRKNYGIQLFIVTYDDGLLPRAGLLSKYFRQFDLRKVKGLLFLKNNKLKITFPKKGIFGGVKLCSPSYANMFLLIRTKEH